MNQSTFAGREEELSELMAVFPVLVHVNGVNESVIEADYFHSIIDFSDAI
jgi:hypothetical protein